MKITPENLEKLYNLLNSEQKAKLTKLREGLEKVNGEYQVIVSNIGSDKIKLENTRKAFEDYYNKSNEYGRETSGKTENIPECPILSNISRSALDAYAAGCQRSQIPR